MVSVRKHPAERFIDRFLSTSPRLYIRHRRTDKFQQAISEVFKEIAPFFDELKAEWEEDRNKVPPAGVEPACVPLKEGALTDRVTEA